MSSSPTPPPSSPHSAPSASLYRNLGTMVPGVAMLRAWESRVKQQSLTAQEVYGMALAAERLREPQAEPGYRLYWFGASLLGSLDVPAWPSRYAVVGRHGSCDVVIDDERLVSLRHVLVRAALDDGFPVLSVLDLQTSAGFELSDGSRQRSIAASGPLVFRIGAHCFVALPSSGGVEAELPVPLIAPPAPWSPPAEVASPEPRVRHAPVSRITLLPGSVDLASRRSSALSSTPQHAGEPPTGSGYELVLEARGQRAGARLSTADLERGVLVGRADKCVDEGLHAVLRETISRVHVLLIREQGVCRLYDVASLSGTFASGERVRCLPLDDRGTTVQLASRAGVSLQWRAL